MDTLLASSLVKSFLAGSLSGTCSSVLFQPLDLLKTRVQTSINVGSGPVGLSTALGNVIRHETVMGLWKGVAPSVARCVPGVGIYFSSLHFLRSRFGSADPPPLESALVGVTARSVAAITMLPVTILKTRYESTEFQCRNMARGFYIIFHQEGLRGLYIGLIPTLVRDVPFSGLYLMIYTQIKKKAAATYTFSEGQVPYVNFSCGLVAGVVASVITQPADVIKTHMQVYPKQYGGLVAASRHVYDIEGLKGFLRGTIPRSLRRTLTAAMVWTVYEQVMRSCGIKV